MHIARLVLLVSLCCSCVVGAPLGFSDGDSWSIPVMGGLEDGQLIAPVKIGDRGPYLFFVNPHSKSIIDPRLVKECDLYMERTERGISGASDTITHEKTDYAEAPSVTIGDLTVKRRTFIVLPQNASFHGQPVLGTIGTDFLDKTLIWTFDRDRQMVYLATQGHQMPPAAATRVKADRISGGRFYVDGKVNGKSVYLYMDLGLSTSVLWESVAKSAGLEDVAGLTATDFFGRRYRYSAGFNAIKVELGGVATRNLVFAPYRDERERPQNLDGFLGRDFFARYHVTVNWHEKSIWLEQRTVDLNELLDARLERWGARLDGCETPACVRTAIERDDAGAVSIAIARDPAGSGAAYDVLLEAVDEGGKPVGLPRLLAAFPAGATGATVSGDAAAAYAPAAGLRVVDLTPFPPPCEPAAPDRGCLWQMQ